MSGWRSECRYLCVHSIAYSRCSVSVQQRKVLDKKKKDKYCVCFSVCCARSLLRSHLAMDYGYIIYTWFACVRAFLLWTLLKQYEWQYISIAHGFLVCAVCVRPCPFAHYVHSTHSKWEKLLFFYGHSASVLLQMNESKCVVWALWACECVNHGNK